MKQKSKPAFDEESVLSNIRKYLPEQAPLKDFVHHNTLHAFQSHPFKSALELAGKKYGYRVYQPLYIYRELLKKQKINRSTLQWIISRYHNQKEIPIVLSEMENLEFGNFSDPQIGKIRNQWKNIAHINIEKEIHPVLFRFTGAFIDQGVSHTQIPINGNLSFIDAIKIFQNDNKKGIFKSKRSINLLNQQTLAIEELLKIIVGDELYFVNYLEDAIFAHPGWSGMVNYIENHPNSLVIPRNITLNDFLKFQLLLEIETLDQKLGSIWKPLSEQDGFDRSVIQNNTNNNDDKLYHYLHLFQESLEFSYYQEIIDGLSIKPIKSESANVRFQAAFCIDDRECSLRRHIERIEPDCETFGTAGFFQVPFYFLPNGAKELTKVCPAPITPKNIISEVSNKTNHAYDYHLSNSGNIQKRKIWLPHFRGFWAGWKLAKSIFWPSPMPSMVSSFKHMEKAAKLEVDTHKPKNELKSINNLKWGFDTDEQIQSVESLLRGMGLTKNFSPFVYLVGHGASSVNNTHFAGYDCGACSGRSGSANARVAAIMANNPAVRFALVQRGIFIPDETIFIGALHDTTRDEIDFYIDIDLSEYQKNEHHKNVIIFNSALTSNAAERARKFDSIPFKSNINKIHSKVKLRSVSLFEPRPEWNHATNALCIVGPRVNNKHLFFDRKAFLNSYDPNNDPEGTILESILSAVTPVCGGINLEYYFSTNDQTSLGAGSKLPHNVMGLVGVANGIDGDLRTGLPEQMVSIHNPLRLLVIVDQNPDLVSSILNRNQSLMEWYSGEWIFLMVKDPKSENWFRWNKNEFIDYSIGSSKPEVIIDWFPWITKNREDFSIFLTKEVAHV